MTDSKVVTKEELVTLLRQQLRSAGIPHSHVGLPRDIAFSSRDGVLKTRVLDPSGNMQSNSSAFEAWTTVLKAWLPHLAGKVELSCSLPLNYSVGSKGRSEACHVNRFLYRAGNFLRLYPEWFRLEERLQEKVNEFMLWLRQGPCYLNQPLGERKQSHDTEKRERRVEYWLRFGEDGRTLLSSHCSLDRDKIFNQLPVGVFRETIEQRTAIFTGSAAAIDLWGVGSDGKTLHIIELKSGKNVNVGVISEILFYTFVIYDTCVAKNTLFQFGRYRKSPETSDMTVIQNGGLGFEHLHSHVLGESFHPLFSDQVVTLLDAALSRLGIRFSRARYDYDRRILPA